MNRWHGFIDKKPTKIKKNWNIHTSNDKKQYICNIINIFNYITMDEKLVKILTKWLTVALAVSLVAFPVTGFSGFMTLTPAGVIITGMFWALFALPGAVWLWLILMFAGPVGMHICKGKEDMNAFITRVSCTFASFLGSLLMLIVGEGTGFGTWVCMFVSVILCGVIATDGIMKMNKK